jgi:hypothetical protein
MCNSKGSAILVKSWIGVKILSVGLTITFFMSFIKMNLATVGSNIFYGLTLVASVYFIWIVLALIGQMKTEKEKRPTRFNKN